MVNIQILQQTIKLQALIIADGHMLLLKCFFFFFKQKPISSHSRSQSHSFLFCQSQSPNLENLPYPSSLSLFFPSTSLSHLSLPQALVSVVHGCKSSKVDLCYMIAAISNLTEVDSIVEIFAAMLPSSTKGSHGRDLGKKEIYQRTQFIVFHHFYLHYSYQNFVFTSHIQKLVTLTFI